MTNKTNQTVQTTLTNKENEIVRTKHDLKKIQETLTKFNNDIESINREIKKIQSIKCRLKKQKFKSSYNSEMSEILKYEQIVKEAKSLLNPREKFVTEYNEQDVNVLTLDQTIHAIRSIQSKKTLSKFLVENLEENSIYQNAKTIEDLLIAHKNVLIQTNQDIDKVKKTEIVSIIETIENNETLSKEELIRLLEKLTK